jgi:hypothetical protein
MTEETYDMYNDRSEFECKFCKSNLSTQPMRLQVDWYGKPAYKLTYFCQKCGADYMKCLLDDSQEMVWHDWDEPGTNEVYEED